MFLTEDFMMTDLSDLDSELLPLGFLQAGRKRSVRKPSSATRTGPAEQIANSMPPPRDPPHESTFSHSDFPAGESLPLWNMKITQSAFFDAMSHLLGRVPEAAGILVGPTNDDSLVTRFIPDIEGRGTPVTFELNSVHLNRVLKELKPAGLGCKGIIHSHPAGYPQPSYGDVHYFQTLFGRAANSAATYIYTPIVSDGRMFPYVFTRGRVFSAGLVLV